MLASGFSLRAIFESLAEVNAGLAPNRRVTIDSLETHRSRHWPLQAGANAVWRKILEERAAADAADYEHGVVNLVTPQAYFQVLMTKAFVGLTDEAAEVAVSLSTGSNRLMDQHCHTRRCRTHVDDQPGVELSPIASRNPDPAWLSTILSFGPSAD